jgi:hypothetical protein
MAVNFFEREVQKAQKRFNQNFGSEIVCNLEAREAVILSICRIRMLANKIKKPKHNETVRTDNQEFIRIRDVINRFFNLIEKQQKERRGYADRRKHSNNTGNGQQRDRSFLKGGRRTWENIACGIK